MKSTDKHNEKLKSRIKDLLEEKIGIGIAVEIAGSLYIRELENGEYAVGGLKEPHSTSEEEWEENYANLDDAIEKFIKIRSEKKIGDDFWVNEDN